MQVLEKNQSYKGFTRVETRVERFECHEDFLILSKLAEEAAKAAYAMEHAADGAACRAGKKRRWGVWEMVEEQSEHIRGYSILDSDKVCMKETSENEKTREASPVEERESCL